MYLIDISELSLCVVLFNIFHLEIEELLNRWIYYMGLINNREGILYHELKVN
jgi:hypothetical protein